MDAEEMMGTDGDQTLAFESGEGPKESLGHVWFIWGQMTHGKWSHRPGSRETDVGRWRHGHRNRNGQMRRAQRKWTEGKREVG